MKVLIVDDEKNVRHSIRNYLELTGLETAEAQNGLSAQRMLREEVFAAVVLDLRMPGMSGIELLAWMGTEGIRSPVVMISAHGEIRDAVEAMKLGASDYLVKPFDPDELVIRLNRVIEDHRLKTLAELENRTIPTDVGLVGDGPSMMEVKKTIEKVAGTPATVLITGESGVGKEIVARAVHASSSVADGPFVAVNLGAVPEPLMESELFGHEKGAFTGAASQRSGVFELASGGTIFLDEIGEIPVHLQVKLLRVLQERQIQRVGGNRSIPVAVRVLAATNRDLEVRIAEGAFREDLFYRLNVVNIHVPALRERIEDIELLAAHLLEKHNRRIGRQLEGFSSAAIEALSRYDWPGNVRELENIVERAVIFADAAIIDKKDLNLPRGDASRQPRPLRKLKEAERELIIEALHVWEGNKSKAADALGITRRTLFNKIKEYGLD